MIHVNIHMDHFQFLLFQGQMLPVWDSWMPNIQDSIQIPWRKGQWIEICIVYIKYIYIYIIWYDMIWYDMIWYGFILKIVHTIFNITSLNTITQHFFSLRLLPLYLHLQHSTGATWWVMKFWTSKITGRSANVFKLTPGSSVRFCWKPTRTAGHIHCPASIRKITGFCSKPLGESWRRETKIYIFNHSHWSSLNSGCYKSPLINLIEIWRVPLWLN